MSENRVDPTVAALFLVGFITMVFGLIGIAANGEGDGIFSNLTKTGGLLATAIGVIFIVLTVMAAKSNNAFATALFAFIAAGLLATETGLTTQSPLLIIFIGIFFLIFAIVAFIVGAPKLLFLQLVFVFFLYLFVGLWLNATVGGDDGNTYALLFGVFGILAGIVATYLGFALATEKLPVI